MELSEKQKQRPREQNREPRNKTTCAWENNFWQKSQKHIVAKKKKTSSINGAGKIGKPHAKEWNYSLSPHTKIGENWDNCHRTTTTKNSKRIKEF